eukprot:TRINITY_DN3748_c0_g2_i1.p1 TRINITY_DN3748_c0_g2~~TRINITY_DN3748_c0_g2_i1.p1  ORF type:complete len:715 (-),score=158.71 TRINITY_DN3748_c0_g2_i1:184-2328(-)
MSHTVKGSLSGSSLVPISPRNSQPQAMPTRSSPEILVQTDLPPDSTIHGLRKKVVHVQSAIDKIIKSSLEYRNAAAVFSEKGNNLIHDLKAYSALEGQKDPRTDKIIAVLEKIEKMKAALHEKTEVLLTVPMQQFNDTELKPVLSKASELKSLKKKKDEAQAKLKKQKDPYKMKQCETKFDAVKNTFEFTNLNYVSTLKDIEDRKWFNINTWMMAYVFANVAFFRKGFEYLNELENEMRTDTQTIAKEEEQVIEQTQKRISKIQSLQKSETQSEKEKHGYLTSKGKPIWVIVADGNFSYYKSWQEAIPISSIDLTTATVKPNDSKFSFDVISPMETVSLKASTQEEMDVWLKVFRHNIVTQLETHKKAQLRQNTISESAHTLVSQIYDISESNHVCADCGAKDPDWASINIGCIVCHECSGVHRMLGAHISKIRSLTLDKWEPQIFQLLKYMGNNAVNKIYESNITPPYTKLQPTADRQQREAFITLKYKDKKFVEPSKASKETLSSDIYNIAATSDDTAATVTAILTKIAEGADVNWVNEEENNTSVLHYFAATGSLVCVELMLQNGANMNMVDAKGWTPLHYAACHDHPGCVRLLINRSANPDIKDNEGNTPLAIAQLNSSNNVVALLSRPGDPHLSASLEDDESSTASPSQSTSASPSHSLVTPNHLASVLRGRSSSATVNLEVSNSPGGSPDMIRTRQEKERSSTGSLIQ